MIQHVLNLAMVRRAVEDVLPPTVGVAPGKGNLIIPNWAVAVLLLNLLVFLPLVLFITYTLNTVVPTLAMIEDASPPAYKPVALSDDHDDDETVSSTTVAETPAPVTSSVRATLRLLYSLGGFRGMLRGFWVAFFANIVENICTLVFSSALPFVPNFVAGLLGSLATVQLSTLWQHVVTSTLPPVGAFRRVPPFRKTLEATALPVLAYWAARYAVVVLARATMNLLALRTWSPGSPNNLPPYDFAAPWKTLIVLLLLLVGGGAVIVPAEVVLVRVRASLLPPDEDTIVPSDRTFGGRVGPAIGDDKASGFATARDALASFPRRAWIRLYVLYVKVWVSAILCYVPFLAILFAQAYFMSAANKGEEDDL